MLTERFGQCYSVMAAPVGVQGNKWLRNGI
jgi:hypothetical protein